jgi:hypothetical protein
MSFASETSPPVGFGSSAVSFYSRPSVSRLAERVGLPSAPAKPEDRFVV